MTLWMLLSALWLSSAYATITLNTPTGNFVAKGTLLLTWTFATGDPDQFQLQITGPSTVLTMTPFMQTKNLNATVPLPDVPTGQYTFQAVNTTNISQVYSGTSSFTISAASSSTATSTSSTSTGSAPSTVSTSSTFFSATSTGNTVTSSFGSTPASMPTQTPDSGNKSIAGLVAGGVIGGLAFIALLVVLFFFWRKRNHRMHTVQMGTAPSSQGFLSHYSDGQLPPATVPTETDGSSMRETASVGTSLRTPYQAVPSSLNTSTPALFSSGDTNSDSRSLQTNPQLTPEQNDFIHDLYRRNIPSSVIAGIINRFLQGDSSAATEYGWNTSGSAQAGLSPNQIFTPNRASSKSIPEGAPPRYDQIV